MIQRKDNMVVSEELVTKLIQLVGGDYFSHLTSQDQRERQERLDKRTPLWNELSGQYPKFGDRIALLRDTISQGEKQSRVGVEFVIRNRSTDISGTIGGLLLADIALRQVRDSGIKTYSYAAVHQVLSQADLIGERLNADVRTVDARTIIDAYLSSEI